MAGFSLGGGGGDEGGSGSRRGGRGGRGEQNTEESIPPESLFIYGASNTATNTRGFELWHQQQQQQHHHLHQFYSSPPTMLGFSSSDNIQLGGAAAGPMRGGGSSSTSGGVGGMSCQDCGNQAKKDCPHMRCRTCCKSRGFHCTTHVRSTWVPASRRRERQQQLAAAAVASTSSSQQQQRGGDLVRSGSGGEGSKRPRELLSSNARAVTATGGMNFPAEVSSPAVFRCVRVSSMDEAADDEFAYQTAVSIGGHMFRGILYDQGPEAQYHHQGESSSSTAAAIATTAAAATAVAAAGTSNAAGSAGLMQDPSSASMYPTPLSAFMAGTQFFPHHPRP